MTLQKRRDSRKRGQGVTLLESKRKKVVGPFGIPPRNVKLGVLSPFKLENESHFKLCLFLSLLFYSICTILEVCLRPIFLPETLSSHELLGMEISNPLFLILYQILRAKPMFSAKIEPFFKWLKVSGFCKIPYQTTEVIQVQLFKNPQP